ncbi:MAG: redoxin domain-containing protein [Anaerolineae bacterium]|nr:redoxin domain-containing protein [Anaerolineae bacterium]MCA9908563.1 redoxin domain-containing protein [Anaerolineae bacterium]
MPLQIGHAAPDFSTHDIDGAFVSAAQFRGQKWMISFFRFAACPYCNLRVHELSAKAGLLRDKLQVVTVFQSPAETLRRHNVPRRIPFTIVADPEMALFELYQGELSTAKFISGHVLHPLQWVQGVAQGAFQGGATVGELRLVPADFLIDEQGIIQQAHYGRDVTDHMPLRDITAFAG